YPPQVLGLGQTGRVLPIKNRRFSVFLSSGFVLHSEHLRLLATPENRWSTRCHERFKQSCHSILAASVFFSEGPMHSPLVRGRSRPTKRTPAKPWNYSRTIRRAHEQSSDATPVTGISA